MQWDENKKQISMFSQKLNSKVIIIYKSTFDKYYILKNKIIL